MTSTIRESATISVTVKTMTFTGCAEFDVIPGEPMVRYYPDGSGYPGSDTEVDNIDFHVEEVEYELSDYDEETDRSDRYGYRTREELSYCAEIADELCRRALSDGSHDDELLAGVDSNGDEDYDDRDD
jgi:hypothetical protein